MNSMGEQDQSPHRRATRPLVARCTAKEWSLCDAISFAVMERRRVRTAFSFDAHFRQ
jgi:predicted nucleic acid-binding protein